MRGSSPVDRGLGFSVWACTGNCSVLSCCAGLYGHREVVAVTPMVVVGRVCATQVSGVHGHVPAEVAVDSCLWRIVVWLYVLFDSLIVARLF